jgi:hypothetical protein
MVLSVAENFPGQLGLPTNIVKLGENIKARSTNTNQNIKAFIYMLAQESKVATLGFFYLILRFLYSTSRINLYPIQ